MGGDLAPKAAVEGAVLAARDFGLEVVLVGIREIVETELAAHDTTGLAIRVEHAAEVVAMDDSPLESVLTKPHSSLHVGMELVKRGDVHGFVSAGNSGAMMAAAMAILGNLPHVDRPAIASLIPATGGMTLLIDAGANTEVKPLNLAQFAVMGSVYSRRVRNIARPRVGILSNGEESSKGTDLTRHAAEMLTHMAAHVNYVGYVEGRDINRGKADVVVTDGFTGNVALARRDAQEPRPARIRRRTAARRQRRRHHRARIVDRGSYSQRFARRGQRSAGAPGQRGNCRNSRQE
jgi:glycerol-3-phosphate acyltransferase PlsX